MNRTRHCIQDSKNAVAALAGLLVLACFLAVPQTASAELYKYRRSDGSLLITTERHPELELVEVLSGGGSSSHSSSGSKVARNDTNEEDDAVRRAKKMRRRHRRSADPSPSKGSSSERPRRQRFDDLVKEASEAYEVPFSFIKAVIRVESDFTPDAVSHAGAMGLMQLMPQTADYLNVTNPFDPRQNVFGGTKLLRILIDRYDGDINLILSAYNAGDAAVEEYDGIPYRKTRQYVASVYRFYKYYSKKQNGEGEE